MDENADKKYLMLIEATHESMAGLTTYILAKFADTEEELNQWAETKNPEYKRILLNNTPELAEFFETSTYLADFVH